MLRIAQEDGKIQTAPSIRLLKEPPARKGFLEKKDFDRLKQTLPANLRPVVLLLYWCGVRIGEAEQIEWPQVDLKARAIRLEPEQTKTDEAHILPLPSELASFLNRSGLRHGRVFDLTNLRKEWKGNGRRLVQRAGSVVSSKSRVSPSILFMKG
jgi:integrase